MNPLMLQELARELANEAANHLYLPQDVSRVRELAKEYLLWHQKVLDKKPVA